MPDQMIQFGSFTIDTVTRTAITVPVACRIVKIRNRDTANDVTLYDAASGGNSQVFAAGEEREYRPSGSGVTWREGDTVVWATASAGTGPIGVEYHR